MREINVNDYIGDGEHVSAPWFLAKFDDTVFIDSSGDVSSVNPITSDHEGRFPIVYSDSARYFDLIDPTGVTVRGAWI